MKKIEYKTIKVDTSAHIFSSKKLNEIDTELNELGKEGWDLVGVVPILRVGATHYGYYTFKRELKR